MIVVFVSLQTSPAERPIHLEGKHLDERLADMSRRQSSRFFSLAFVRPVIFPDGTYGESIRLLQSVSFPVRGKSADVPGLRGGVRRHRRQVGDRIPIFILGDPRFWAGAPPLFGFAGCSNRASAMGVSKRRTNR